MTERDLFLSALDIDDPAERRAHVQTACAGDADLLGRVESLLVSHERESLFLQTPVAEQMGIGSLGDPTIVIGTGSTFDGPGAPPNHGPAAMPHNAANPDEDDEILLGYLEPSTRPDARGRLGHYEILEIIGRGAFGTVLKAFDEKLHRVVAIKMLAPQLAVTSPARKRFLREAQNSAQIRHEHVVNVYAVEEKPIPYLVMEYIPGETLQQRLDERGPLDVPTVLRLGVQIAEALAAAHAMDLIHRDVKPGNILLETSIHDRVKITDFGLARTADDASMTQSGVIAGTPMYMAPEQALGGHLDQRADLFSFGSVLYQMVSGRPPFRAPSTLAVLKRVTEEQPRPIVEIIPETPAWLCDIISKLHAKNPDDRYQTAREIADVLANCEAQLKAHDGLQDYSRIPRPVPAPQVPSQPEPQPLLQVQPTQATPPRALPWKWIAAALVLLPLVAWGGYSLFARFQTAAKSTAHGQEFAGWGTIVDPRRDCPVTADKDGLTITVPGGEHNLNPTPRFNDLTAPRVLQSVAGDFELETRIAKFPPPETEPGAAKSYKSYNGAGLLLWQDEKNFVRFLRSANGITGNVFFHIEYFRDGVAIANKAVNIPNVPLSLRIVREDGEIHAYCESQSNQWRKVMLSETITLADKLQVGVAATNTAAQPFTARFVHLHLRPRTTGEKGWAPLFNGQDLAGWKTHPDQPGDWTVKDGILTGRGAGRRDLSDRSNAARSHLFSERGDFENFHLRLEARMSDKGNSGVVVRSEYGLGFDQKTVQGFGHLPLGYEADMHAVADHAFMPGSVWRLSATPAVWKSSAAAIKPNTWFEFEVIADGSRIETRINGKTVLEAEDDIQAYRRGHIALQVESGGTQIDFRNIEIKVLPPTSDAQASDDRQPPPAHAPFNAAQAKAHQTAWAKHLGVPVEYENSLKMKFRLIPPGTFTMGSSPEEIALALKANEKNRTGDDLNWHRDRINSEGPAHEVEITKPIYIAATHVTVGQYRQFAAKDGRLFRDGRWDRPGWEQTDEHPVVFTAWADAQAFCRWLDAEEELEYRLPTEAEWELACRAGTTTAYSFGDSEDDLARHGWFKSNSQGHTQPVAKFAANPFGLYDMHGNAWQWCQDPHHPDFYKTSPKQDPLGKGDGCIMRGGSWENFAVECRSAFRNSATLAPAAQRGKGSGFRVAISVESVQDLLHRDRPFTDADSQRIAALPALQQVAEVRKELMRLNPDFDGTVTPTIDGDIVTEFSINTDHVTNIAPVRALKGLIYLDCRGTYPNKGQLSEISPLKGMTTISHLDCSSTQISDLTPIAGLPLTNLQFNHNPVSDLTPLKNMPLLTLGCAETKVADLSPIKGLKLKILGAQLLPVTDLSPLAGMPLTGIDLYHTIGVTNIEALHGMPLEGLNLQDVPVSDLSPLKGMTTLRMLLLQGCKVSDLSPLEGLQLTELFLMDQQIINLSPLKGMPLKRLGMNGSGATDLRPLQGMELAEIRFAPQNITQGLEVLREMQSLTIIGIDSDHAWPPAEFWERYDKGEFAVAPFTDDDAARIAALPTKEQYAAVAMELKKRNPEFKGTIDHQIDNDQVHTLVIEGTGIKDLLPIKALMHLRDLSFVGGKPDLAPLRAMGLTAVSLYNTEVADLSMLKGLKLTAIDLSGSRRVVDLSPLKEMPLEGLTIYATQVSDLTPLAGLKLKHLNCSASAVRDLSPLKGLPLDLLNLSSCQVADLSPLAGAPLTGLDLRGTLVTDLSPLQDLSLKSILLDFQAARDAKLLRAIKTLETINGKPAAEFWNNQP